MFCYQCQEAAHNTGCTGKIGICGVNDEVIDLQDVFVFTLKGLSYFAVKAREKGVTDLNTDRFITNALFMTITNVNFDADVFVKKIRESLALRREMRKKAEAAGAKFAEKMHESCTWTADSKEEFLVKAAIVGNKIDAPNEDVRSLRALILYGLKGLAAYAEHAAVLGHEKTEIYAFMQTTLVSMTNDAMTTDELVALVMETGKFGVDVLALLDTANTSAYGMPEITKVKTGTRNNPAILISGHDLKDLKDLLEQTQGTGVDVYTHSEMLPAHYYPEFKKYENFVGNYGNAWWQQKEEFTSFNGPVLFTTNCIVPPKSDATYADKVYTTGAAGFPGFKHIETSNGTKDFSEIIEHAKKSPAPTQIEDGEIVGGFAHNQVLALADKVVDAVKSGAIKKFFVMAGCDGRQNGRSYYTYFAAELPKDTVVLTAGCAKYRYNKLEMGDIGGIPRVLDAGQCNDSYSLAVIALKLKEVFELEDINDLPIAYNIAWYEQKAVIVLLALLHLGVKNIHLGPTLPAFLSPNVAKVLVETFGIGGTSEVKADIEMFMAN
ncbi:MAG: hydroxylamine reductase [Bacteroidales bacterium]|nr:hydroxylamine reductase [Bacteroidales bacterium]MCF8456903.1 hydroxylamine reductase [Bacteroidales bacterium]